MEQGRVSSVDQEAGHSLRTSVPMTAPFLSLQGYGTYLEASLG